jgi:hypothetical protein
MEKSKDLAQSLQALMDTMRRGVNLSTAIHAAGLSTVEVYGWMQRGRLEEERLQNNTRAKPKASEEACLGIWQEIRAANAQSIAEMELAVVRAAKEGEWKAAAWWLEKRNTEMYGKSAGERKPVTVGTIEKELEK